MNSPLHLKNCVKSAGHRTVSGWSLTTPYGARPGIGRCYHIRRRPASVRYVTTQEKILKNRPVPGWLSNSPVMCKSVKSYDVSFICDHSIKQTYDPGSSFLSLTRLILKSSVRKNRFFGWFFYSRYNVILGNIISSFWMDNNKLFLIPGKCEEAVSG